MVSDQIRKFRNEKGWSQQRLAEVAHVSIGSVIKWEGGAAVPGGDSLEKLAIAFDCTMDELWRGSPEPEPASVA